MTAKDAQFGATFIADLFAILLFGLATVQTAIFCNTNQRIPYLNKLTVLLLWLLNGLHVAITIHVTYYYLVTKGGIATGELVWTYVASTVLELFLTNATQILYSVRLWQLLKQNSYRMILFVPLVALIVFSLVMNIYIPLQVSHVRNIPSLAFVESWAPTLDFCASSVIDFWLSFSLIYCLAKSGKRLDWADTGAVVLAAYALNTGIIASVFSLLPLITFAAMPDNLIFFAFKIVLTGLYVNSFLAMLNSRHYFQRPEALVRVSLPQGTMAYDRGIHHGTRPSHPVPTITDAPHDCTINEAGLPLFKPKNSSSGHSPHDIQLLEVKVGKEEHQDRGD